MNNKSHHQKSAQDRDGQDDLKEYRTLMIFLIGIKSIWIQDVKHDHWAPGLRAHSRKNQGIQ
ncbi:hypothetical protein OQJ13_07560 [Legionella sp. PATHC035]|uniref:hypothetical protein n=1 Tax=Legionella sp. PATHC035 TaxID=2992040 RepID=UPI0022449D42|nr:hypothetical protein [Legionella sp. PATHC035]MCW8408826.1 hypothetical protein [Legionella sp. PATHC035]